MLNFLTLRRGDGAPKGLGGMFHADQTIHQRGAV
jgi:hypothetical protein